MAYSFPNSFLQVTLSTVLSMIWQNIIALHVSLLNEVLLFTCGNIERSFTFYIWHYRTDFICTASSRYVWHYQMNLSTVTGAMRLLDSPKLFYLSMFVTFHKPLPNTSSDVIEAIPTKNFLYPATDCSMSTPHHYAKKQSVTLRFCTVSTNHINILWAMSSTVLTHWLSSLPAWVRTRSMHTHNLER